MLGLDAYDRKILSYLEINARTPASAIGRKVRMPKETVNYRIRRLVRQGYIKYFYALVNAARLGYHYYTVYLKFDRLTGEVEKELLRHLLSEKTCSKLRITEGPFDMVFVSMHKNLVGLRDFLQRFYESFGGYILRKSIHVAVSGHKLNHKFLFPYKIKRYSMHYGQQESYRLNPIEVSILKNLSTKARVRITDLAQSIKCNPRTVQYYIKKLERNEVIVGYSASINLGLFNREMVQVDISLKKPEKTMSIIEFFDSKGTCLFAHELMGRYDLSVELNVKDDGQLRKILQGFREAFLNDYISYDVSHVFREHVLSWSPF